MLDKQPLLQALSLAANYLTGDVAEALGDVWGSKHLQCLNVSNNEELTMHSAWLQKWADLHLLEVVAIERTNIPTGKHTLNPEDVLEGPQSTCLRDGVATAA